MQLVRFVLKWYEPILWIGFFNQKLHCLLLRLLHMEFNLSNHHLIQQRLLLKGSYVIIDIPPFELLKVNVQRPKLHHQFWSLCEGNLLHQNTRHLLFSNNLGKHSNNNLRISNHCSIEKAWSPVAKEASLQHFQEFFFPKFLFPNCLGFLLQNLEKALCKILL